MYCLKCGKEIPEGQVFCQECLAEMDAYPVKPGTPIQLPVRPSQAPRKNPARRKAASPEEQAHRLRRAVRWLWVSVAALTVALGVAVFLLVWRWQAQPVPQETIGKNYITVLPTD